MIVSQTILPFVVVASDSASKQPTWQGHGSEHTYGLKGWVCSLVPRLHPFTGKILFSKQSQIF